MRAYASVFTALSILFVLGCGGEEAGLVRLHEAQRDFWRAKHFQRRLDIYPNRTIAEDCLARYQEIIRRYPPSDLPAGIADPEGVAVKLARVGAMASLGAAGIHRELGQLAAGIACLEAACRPDLPLGAFVERRLRGTLGSFLTDSGRAVEAVQAYQSLLSPLAPDLPEGHAAYPDRETLALPRLMIELARDEADPAFLSDVRDFTRDYFERVSRFYSGSDAERIGLLEAADIAMALESWQEASEILARLALRFPDQEPWRADLRRARLLSEQLDRSDESERILARWVESEDREAAVEAGKQRIRLYLNTARLDAAEAEIQRIKRSIRDRRDMAELLYLWGRLEFLRDSWEEARPRWGQAAATHPYSRYGLEAQLAVAEGWAARQEPRFAAGALSRLFAASLRNTRHNAGSEMARISLAIESRADSLLGILPATEPTVRNLLDRRGPRTDIP